MRFLSLILVVFLVGGCAGGTSPESFSDGLAAVMDARCSPVDNRGRDLRTPLRLLPAIRSEDTPCTGGIGDQHIDVSAAQRSKDRRNLFNTAGNGNALRDEILDRHARAANFANTVHFNRDNPLATRRRFRKLVVEGHTAKTGLGEGKTRRFHAIRAVYDEPACPVSDRTACIIASTAASSLTSAA